MQISNTGEHHKYDESLNQAFQKGGVYKKELKASK